MKTISQLMESQFKKIEEGSVGQYRGARIENIVETNKGWSISTNKGVIYVDGDITFGD